MSEALDATVVNIVQTMQQVGGALALLLLSRPPADGS
jgi:hypothetical protein